MASAVVTLVGIGALTHSEKLTPLGQLLTKLPVDVHLGERGRERERDREG